MVRPNSFDRLVRVAAAVIAAALVSQAAADAATQPGQALLQELAAARDYRAFALEALQRPAEGGHYYARFVANQCGRDFAAIRKHGVAALQAEIAQTGTIPPFRLALLQDLPDKCASFVSGEPIQIIERVRAQSATGVTDPLIAAGRSALAALRSQEPQALRAAFATLVRINDPLLWTDHLLHLGFAHSNSQAKMQSGELFLDGVVYAESDGLKMLEAKLALDLGYCQPGLPCAPDFLLRTVCAAGLPSCAPDRVAYARKEYLGQGGDEAGWPRVLALQQRVRAALARGDIDMFLR